MSGINYGIKMTKIIAKNENPIKIGTVVGKVISTNPLSVSILNGKVVLFAQQLYINSNLALLKNDLVKVTPAENEQTWFIDYKLKKVGD